MSHNTLLHRLVRPLVRPLVGTPVTPNHLTTLRLATGIAAALAFAIGAPDWTAIGGAIYLLSALLDRADGELARQSRRSSAWGHRYDLWSDYASHVMAFAGLGFGLRGVGLGWWGPMLGLVAGAAIVAVLWLVTQIERQDGQGAAVFGTAFHCDPDDILLIIPLAAWTATTQALVIAAAIGAPSFSLWAYWRYRRRL